MTAALTTRKFPREERWTFHLFPLKAGQKVFRGTMACLDLTTGYVVQGAPGASLKWIGFFDEDVDNTLGTSGALSVNVYLVKERVLAWWANDTASPIVQADIGSNCYILDNQTVTLAASGDSVCGVVWALGPLGVLVEVQP